MTDHDPTDTDSADPHAAAPEDTTIDLATLTDREVQVFLAGVTHGCLQGETAGYTRGHDDAEAELASIQRRAARVVRNAARRAPNPATVDRLYRLTNPSADDTRATGE